MLRYHLLLFILSPVILGHIIWLSIKNRSFRYFQQRLGFNYSSLPKSSFWFHCASVGEVNTVLPLIKHIHQLKPEIKIIISTNTVTGGKIVKQQNLHYLYHCYLPFDWTLNIKRFISAARPLSLQVMETEIWPNLFAACGRFNININIINARLSSKTTSAKPWIKTILKNSLSHVNAIYARTEKDADAYFQLGADKNKISTAGNLKLTTTLVDTDNIKPFSINREYVLAASTRRNEAAEIYKCWKSLNRKELLIIAPRHPERTPSIIKQLDNDNIAIRSKNESITAKTEIYILDTVGELKNYFSNAKFVIMGGSFEPIGGHNILEPASFNKAIITGPYMENFREELELMLTNKAICQVQSYAYLKDELSRLLDDENSRNELQDNTTALTQDVESILSAYTKLILQ